MVSIVSANKKKEKKECNKYLKKIQLLQHQA